MKLLTLSLSITVLGLIRFKYHLFIVNVVGLKLDAQPIRASKKNVFHGTFAKGSHLSPNKFMICDIESTHKILACAEIITIAFIKTDLELNVIERRSWKMAPLLWGPEHDAAMTEAHKIPRDEAMSFPNKKETLREIFKWFNNESYYFAGHFNREMFGITSSYDYALLKQEFLDQSPEAYFRFCAMFDRKLICSSHTLAQNAFERGLIEVPMVVKEGNKKASRDFGLKNICRIMNVTLGEHHTAEADTEACYELIKKFSKWFNIFEVIKNDWRKENEQSNYHGSLRPETGTQVHQQWYTSGIDVDRDNGQMEESGG